MNCSFQISKIDDINLKKYNIVLYKYKAKIKKLLEILCSLNEIKKSPIFKKDINKLIFDLSFCNNTTIQNINKEYRRKDKPTDVITFSLFCDDINSTIYRKTAHLGQIIVSIEKADEQKKSTLEEEIMTLVCHGFLHLIGFDHSTQKDYDFVVDIQNKTIEKLKKNE